MQPFPLTHFVWVGGRGFFFYKADEATQVIVGLRDYVKTNDPKAMLAQALLDMPAVPDWTRVNFTLTPFTGTDCNGMYDALPRAGWPGKCRHRRPPQSPHPCT